MKNILNKLVVIVVVLMSSNQLIAQCPQGEIEVTIDFTYTTYYDNGPLIQWDYFAGGSISGNGPYNEDDMITVCVPEGDLRIVGCDEQNGYGWIAVDFTITITEDGSVNGCGAQNGCVLYRGDDSNIPYIDVPCYDEPGTLTNVVVQLPLGPCDASSVLSTGCTNPTAPNYNSCATTDDGSCLLTTINDKCDKAIPIVVEPIENCEGNSIQINNVGNTIDYSPSCGNPGADLFYTFTVPPSGSVTIFSSPFEGGINATVLDTCNGIEYFCDLFIFSETVANLPVGEELILHLWQNDPGNIDVCIQETPPRPLNDVCENALPICGTTYGSNFNATSDSNDPLTSCFGPEENTIWFSFEANSSGDPITFEIIQGFCGEYFNYLDALQIQLLSGPCGGPYIDEDCAVSNNSGVYLLNLLNPIVGKTYFILVDGKKDAECVFTIEPSGGIQSCISPQTGNFNCSD